VVQRFGGRDWSLLTDRFYRRYLRREDLEPAVELMNEVKKIFSTLASDEVDWGKGYRETLIKPGWMRGIQHWIWFFKSF